MDILEVFKDVKPVPKASGNGGRQEGVVPPGKRVYNAKYEVVDASIAVANMVARMKGDKAPIEGGLDDPGIPKKASIPPKIVKPAARRQKPMGSFDLADGDDVVDDIPVFDPPVAPAPQPEHRGHHRPSTMVTMEIRQEHTDGTFSTIMTVGLPVVQVEQNSTSVTLVSPIGGNQYVFLPAAGSDIILNGAGLHNAHVFYPGTSFTLSDYGISCMCFVKAEK